MAIVLFLMVAFVLTIAFFHGAVNGALNLDELWDDFHKRIQRTHTFRFFGDCGTPPTLTKTFAPYCASSVAVSGGIVDGIGYDVFDFTLSRKRDVESQRVHGFVLEVPTKIIKKDIQDSKKIHCESPDGDFMILENEKNKNFSYIVVVENEFRPIAYESINYHSTNELIDIVKNNLTIVEPYVKRFCNPNNMVAA